MNSYELVYDDFLPEQEPLREALCTLGNGYFATRGASAQCKADGTHYPGTYAAGCYNRLKSEIYGRVIENEDLVNLPNWLPLNFRISDAPWFDLSQVNLLAFRQVLDMRSGVLRREIRFKDASARETTVREQRIVHMQYPHLAAIRLELVAENWSGPVAIRSALDGRVVNSGVRRYAELSNRHLEPLDSNVTDDETLCLKMQTNQSEVRIALAARTCLSIEGNECSVQRADSVERDYVATDFTVKLNAGQCLEVEKTIALYTSKDHAISECSLAAREAVAQAESFAGLLNVQARVWEQLWRHFRVDLEEEPPQASARTATILRLHFFHLLQTISHNSIGLDTGVPARGLHGEAYRGHVFWDEIFVFPLLNLRDPAMTRAMLIYRYRRLPAARYLAETAGYRGAMFPWQSGSDGREESQILHYNPRSGRWNGDHSSRQRHVNHAIAFNVWQYYQVTGDLDFLVSYGARIFLEVARFCASLSRFNPERGRYEINGVVGPDEYHESYPGAAEPGLRNNAYTNVMSAWVLWRAGDLIRLLPEERRRELCESLCIEADELEDWERISRKLYVPFHANGIITQFEGYEDLQEFDWEAYRLKYGNIQRLDRILDAEDEDPNCYQLSKQADVLMLFYLFTAEELGTLFDRLGYSFKYETIPSNIDYYLRRTAHGSSLSRVVHSWVLARSDRAKSWRLFTEALESDIADTQGGTTAEGIHLGGMASSVDIIQRCYTGIEARDDVLWFNPCLPEKLRRLRLRIGYRGHSLNLEITRDLLAVRASPSPEKAIHIGFGGCIFELSGGATKTFKLNPAAKTCKDSATGRSS